MERECLEDNLIRPSQIYDKNLIYKLNYLMMLDLKVFKQFIVIYLILLTWTLNSVRTEDIFTISESQFSFSQ
jgi:hypothetical protein